MTPVLWSLDSLDWKLKDKGKIVRRVLKDVKDGDIILMHDIFPSSVEAALELVDILQKGVTVQVICFYGAIFYGPYELCDRNRVRSKEIMEKSNGSI